LKRTAAALAVTLLLSGRGLTAQTPQPAGAVIATLHLGGDSAQVAALPLTGGQIYRLEIAPVQAVVQVRPAATGQRPLPHIYRPPMADRVVWAVLAQRGTHYIELTNPGIGATTVRVIAEGVPMALVAAPSLVYDSTVFDESFPGPRGTVELVEGYAYRLEITPPVGDVTIRSANLPGAPPMVLYPLSTPALGRGGFTRLLVPATTDNYRIDVHSNDLVRVRIVLDAKETAQWMRMSAATRGLPRAGVAARAVMIGPFPALNGVRLGGVGMDFCLGVVPRGAWLGGLPIGGCALSLSYYHRSGDNSTVAFAIAPRFVASRPDAPTQLSLGLSAGIGGTLGTQEQSFSMLGMAAIAERQLAGRLLLEGEAGLTLVSRMGDNGSNPAALAPRLAFGLQLRL